MNLTQLQALETINPTPPPPWQTPAFIEIDIEADHNKAKEKASARQKAAGITVFSDASGQQNVLGAAADTTASQQEPATILSDSMSALQAISNARNKSGQRII
ncbi:hypothetical protein TSTA_017180 [Talaromyces stipitatus ATCC 10500]|uniref:Uncharacterized protein n=1 Tax=Talaromyces stipitatus (strain ATCC 10500 / CBS 375.48 / QM 6759 / NRRL 1006) TaxID=441959 RepID=B8MEL6_TALSN|nr:uncharacterized protein TSTA_017180 [Talaromyces stipitatus ATCC 10500]EED16643.1 hypothetical protein TSTA_017180 [Talaromyces stipitatus ATCC 10500]